MLGLLATIIFGGLSIYLALKRRYPGRITFFSEGAIGLFDSIVRNLPDLDVLYKGDTVSENLVMLKAFFLNTGTKDISEVMVKEPLAIGLPDGYRWLAVNVITPSTGIKVTAVIRDNQSLEFNTDLFRCNEYFRFESLAEVPGPKDLNDRESIQKKLLDAIKITHRIEDTQKVEVKKLPEEKENPFRKRRDLILFFTMTFIFPGLLVVGSKRGEIYRSKG